MRSHSSSVPRLATEAAAGRARIGTHQPGSRPIATDEPRGAHPRTGRIERRCSWVSVRVSPSSPLRARRKRGRPPVLRVRLLNMLRERPGYASDLASRAGTSLFWTREVLKQLETRGLVRSWTFAQADRGGRNLTVHAWRLTTEEERRCGKEDRSATAHASALLSRVLRGRLRVVERANERLVQAARREREISPS